MTMHSPSKTPSGPELSIRRRSHASAQHLAFGSAAPFDAGQVQDPHSPVALQAAWDKLYRARSILEAEQAHLRDDRIAIQGAVEELEMRLQAVIAREERVRQLELKAQLDREDAEEARNEQSAIARITKAPFVMARSVFTGKK